MLDKDEILCFFKDLKFEEESHTYSVKGVDLKYSVSDLYHKYQEPFDLEKMSGLVALKRGCSKDEIKREWKKAGEEACLKGTKTHFFGELYAFDRSLIPSTGKEKAIVRFYDSLPAFYEPFIMELKMYHKQYLFAGTADILMLNKNTNKLIICDYKTNADLYKNYRGKKLLKSFKNLLDNPFNLYQLQLSYYQILLEQTGVEVENRYIVWLKDDGSYELLQTLNYTEILSKDLSNILSVL